MAEDQNRTLQDKFMLRLPDGMRKELKRLAAEDGRSMNAQIIELLNFALQNSGLDIDEIMKMLAAQRAEMSDLRKQISGGGASDDAKIHQLQDRLSQKQELLDEYKLLLTHREHLLRAVCLQVLTYRDGFPPEISVLAEQLIGKEFDPPLEESEYPGVPRARQALAVREAKKAGDEVKKLRAGRAARAK